MLGRETRTPIRVYYEDTDFSGRVYHASFVRFLERGRSEWLREAGLAHRELAALGLAFAVTRLEVDFLAAAFIDDALTVLTQVDGMRGPLVVFRQSVERAGAILAAGLVKVATIKGDRATRPPRELRELLMRERA